MKNKMLKMIVAASIAISVTVFPVQAEGAVKNPFKDVPKTARIMRLSMKCGTSGLLVGTKTGNSDRLNPFLGSMRRHSSTVRQN